jgi:hypothetical protein
LLNWSTIVATPHQVFAQSVGEIPHGASLNLPYPLSREVQIFSNLVKRMASTVSNVKRTRVFQVVDCFVWEVQYDSAGRVHVEVEVVPTADKFARPRHIDAFTS